MQISAKLHLVAFENGHSLLNNVIYSCFNQDKKAHRIFIIRTNYDECVITK